jgi:hypothetical protein
MTISKLQAGMDMEIVTACFEVLSHHLPGETEGKTTKYLSHDSQSPDQDLNMRPPKHDTMLNENHKKFHSGSQLCLGFIPHTFKIYSRNANQYTTIDNRWENFTKTDLRELLHKHVHLW